ncbi:hypothetical protein [Streptomyces sp. NRRL F-5630]|uniref:hypothetical protein n=1 Tax=Streptomyces sp. NRRL F-5630 TaxID=1463864 RepID=UPI003D709FF3
MLMTQLVRRSGPVSLALSFGALLGWPPWTEDGAEASLGLEMGHVEGAPPIKRSRQQEGSRSLTWALFKERVTRIELAL